MPSSEQANWQPISQLPLTAGMIDGAVDDTAEHMQMLAEARARPHVLDDAIVGSNAFMVSSSNSSRSAPSSCGAGKPNAQARRSFGNWSVCSNRTTAYASSRPTSSRSPMNSVGALSNASWQ
jgi:hypothetical protein